MNVLVINCGSSSVKFQVVDLDQGKVQVSGTLERIGELRSHRQALEEVVQKVKDASFSAVGHRVVHGGAKFHDAVLIDESVIADIEACIPLAPLHNPANLAGIRAARTHWPQLPHVAVFDTAFHARLPRRARTYALNPDLAKKYDIRRYGFHGTSHSYAVQRTAEFLGEPLTNLRVISLHLGNGASACAVEFGSSVETSMGLTPLEGLAMGTRSGDLDPGVVLLLAREFGVEKTEQLLNQSSGLAGLSGCGSDMRDIQDQAEKGNDRARLAVTVFAHRCRKYIGAYAAVMGGVEAIVLTGGIGENSAEMRRRILQRLEFLGVRIDEDKNRDVALSDSVPVFDVSERMARVRTVVVASNEEQMIAQQTAKLAGGHTSVSAPGPIPIAISARHVHLNRSAMDVLFGQDSELAPHKPLSQPGQYAAEQKVNLVGPRNRIEGVRVLGPLRENCQIEVSRTDEFRLGVDAPVRPSGKLKGAAPIVLEGPRGTLRVAEGLICAWRHIHMTPADAKAYGVKDEDLVEVEITDGPRELIFGDVMIRVNENFSLEMHIDTDEANAAELSCGDSGSLLCELPGNGATATLRQKR